MKQRNFPRHFFIGPLVPLVLIGLSGSAMADPIDDAEYVPVSPAEMVFINEVVEQVKASVPPMDGWTQKITVNLSQHTVREGVHPMIYERARDFPLNISVSVNFQEITEADRQKQAHRKSAEELQEEMMQAAMSGDTEKMEKLQHELAATMQAQMEAGLGGHAPGATPAAPTEKAAKFYVQVIVNGDGESIGKKYGIAVPGVARAFRLDKGSDEMIGYKYYLGGWDVSELDASNWRIVAPKEDQTAANHLRALVLFVSIHGARDSTENYVANNLDLEGLNTVLD